MGKIMVAILDDRSGELTSGYLAKGFEDAKIGDRVTVIGQDENGMDFEATGILDDIAGEQE